MNDSAKKQILYRDLSRKFSEVFEKGVEAGFTKLNQSEPSAERPSAHMLAQKYTRKGCDVGFTFTESNLMRLAELLRDSDEYAFAVNWCPDGIVCLSTGFFVHDIFEERFPKKTHQTGFLFRGNGARAVTAPSDSKLSASEIAEMARGLELFLSRTDFGGEVINLEPVQRYERLTKIVHRVFENYERSGYAEITDFDPEASTPIAYVEIAIPIAAGQDFLYSPSAEERYDLVQAATLADDISVDINWQGGGSSGLSLNISFTVANTFSKFES